MCDKKGNLECDMENENFKSCFARSVVVNSQYKLPKREEFGQIDDSEEIKDNNSIETRPNLSAFQRSPVHYRKNNRSTNMDDSRRFSCGSIVSRRASLTSYPKRNEIPVENIYNQNKIDTLQWQLKEIEKSRGMYKAVLKQIVTFLEKAHVSLEHLGTRMNRKNSVPRSKSEHHISPSEDHLTSSWTPSKKPSDNNPEEVPPKKLAQEAFRLLRTAQSLLNTQEPNLASSEDLNATSEEPSDVEFLAQLAKEFPSEQNKPQRTTSFSVSPKLILPESDPSIRISTAFNRKLSLQLSEMKHKSYNSATAKSSVTDSECYSLPPQADYLKSKNLMAEKSPPATASISSTEDESGFSSLNSFQEVGLPLVNSTAVDEVSARSVLLKSMLQNNSDYSSLNDSSLQESALTSSGSSRSNKSFKFNKKESSRIDEERLCDVKLWQKPQLNVQVTATLEPSHKRWNSTPERKSDALKVLWV